MSLIKTVNMMLKELVDSVGQSFKDTIAPPFEPLTSQSWVSYRVERLMYRLGYMKITRNNPFLYPLVSSVPGLDRRLDDHRELMSIIASKTDLVETDSWVKGQLFRQDDFLQRLFYARYHEEPSSRKELFKHPETPFKKGDPVKKHFQPPEWIEIVSNSQQSDELSGAEWSLVTFILPVNTPRMVAEFIVKSLRPSDGVSLSSYCQSTGEGEFVNLGADLKSGRYSLSMALGPFIE